MDGAVSIFATDRRLWIYHRETLDPLLRGEDLALHSLRCPPFSQIRRTSMTELRGVIAASVTPLNGEGSPHGDLLSRHVHHLLERGCHYVLLFGTTGEGLSFTVGERRDALHAVVSAGVDPARLLVGTGANALPDAVALTQDAHERGVAGILLLPPFHFTSVAEDGAFLYFNHIIKSVDDVDLRILLYHYPSLTGVPVTFPLIQRLIDQHGPVIAGVKDSSREWDHMQALCRSFPELGVFAGTERFLTPILGVGGAGCISATVNLTTPLTFEVYHRVTQGRPAEDLQERLTGFRSELSGYPLIPAIKSILSQKSGDSTWTRTRPPVLSPTVAMTEKLQPLVDRLDRQLETGPAS